MTALGLFAGTLTTLSFLPQVIRGYLGDGSSLGVRIEYAVEEQALGTAGSVRNAKEHLDETFVVELLGQRGVRRGEDVGGRALADLSRERVRAAERVLLVRVDLRHHVRE